MSRTLHCRIVYRYAFSTGPSLLLHTVWWILFSSAVPSVRHMLMLETFRWERERKKKTRQQKQAFQKQHSTVGPCLVTVGPPRLEGWGGAWDNLSPKWWALSILETDIKALRASLLPSSCKTRTQPEQILGKTTEWKRRHKDPSRIVSTAAIANNCFPLTALTVILQYSSDWVRFDIQQGEFLFKVWKVSWIVIKLFGCYSVWCFFLAKWLHRCHFSPSTRLEGVCCSLGDL